MSSRARSSIVRASRRSRRDGVGKEAASLSIVAWRAPAPAYRLAMARNNILRARDCSHFMAGG